ncbi:MAG: hypothetical protein HYX87_04215 [Chloroflexi bacterium]|nr:hypothetical protein [Chloroflexota bacterium]
MVHTGTERQTKKVLITVRTYPVPSKSLIEVSCTAGITDDGHWIRLYPVPYRFLDYDKRFTKYQYIEAQVTKPTSDTRPESYRVDPETISVVSPVIPTTNTWQQRKAVIYPLKARSMCDLQEERNLARQPTLGFIKPTITKLVIKPTSPEWTEAELARLRQFPLFGNAPKSELVKLPFDFRYQFVCEHSDCPGHDMLCTDWEMGWSYLKWKAKYESNWEQEFRKTYERMMQENDTHFFVGTLHGNPSAWIVIGLFYPPKVAESAQQPSLF